MNTEDGEEDSLSGAKSPLEAEPTEDVTLQKTQICQQDVFSKGKERPVLPGWRLHPVRLPSATDALAL